MANNTNKFAWMKLTFCGQDNKSIIILSILCVNKFHIIWFCKEMWVAVQFALFFGSGTCRIFLNNNKQLLIPSHSSTFIPESFSIINFIWSVMAFVLRLSEKASLLVLSSWFSSKMVCLVTSEFEFISATNKYSTGIVRFTKILIVVSIILVALVTFASSLTWMSRGSKSFRIFCPKHTALLNDLKVQSSKIKLRKISSKKAGKK